ncbi:hypothetical protein [Thiohalomonas denitrificans]|nr:hypothetical protein [Thiohalomonas denitrificans]
MEPILTVNENAHHIGCGERDKGGFREVRLIAYFEAGSTRRFAALNR